MILSQIPARSSRSVLELQDTTRKRTNKMQSFWTLVWLMRFKVLNGITSEHVVLQRSIFAVMESELTDKKGTLFRKSLKVRAKG